MDKAEGDKEGMGIIPIMNFRPLIHSHDTMHGWYPLFFPKFVLEYDNK